MWRYGLFDYPTDGSEGDLETWCAQLAQDGWQLWDAGIGAVIVQEGREVRRLSLRREVRRSGEPAADGPRRQDDEAVPHPAQ